MTPVTMAAVLSFLAATPPVWTNAAGPGHEVIRLWPGAAPGAEHATAREVVVERARPGDALRDRYVEGVVTPTLLVFRPTHPNGTGLLLAPGGGYRWVVMDKEGYETAERFAASGVTVFVMTYRLPQEGWTAGPDTPLQDAQRAMRIVRDRATAYGLDAHRLGVMGFSAGGHVAGMLSLAWDRRTYAPIDPADRASARPDFSVLLYPVATMRARYAHVGSRANLLGDHPSTAAEAAYSLDALARDDAPPSFLVHAADDGSVPVENSLALFDALRARKVPVELHVFEEGGHGFGLRYARGKPAEAWPDLVMAWMKRHGWMGGS